MSILHLGIAEWAIADILPWVKGVDATGICGQTALTGKDIARSLRIRPLATAMLAEHPTASTTVTSAIVSWTTSPSCNLVSGPITGIQKRRHRK